MTCRGDPRRLLPAAGEGGAGEEWVRRHHPVLLAHAVRGDAGRAAAGGPGVRPRGAPTPHGPLERLGRSACRKRQMFLCLLPAGVQAGRDLLSEDGSAVVWRPHRGGFDATRSSYQRFYVERWHLKEGKPMLDAPGPGCTFRGDLSAWYCMIGLR